MSMGLATLGLDDDDDLAVVEEKFVAAHAVPSTVVLQLFSLLVWPSSILAGVFAAGTVIGGFVAFILLLLWKEHAYLRTLLLAVAPVYAAGFVAAEGCAPFERTAGAFVGPTLPALLFHISMGGTTLELTVAVAAVFAVVVVAAALELSGTSCRDAAVTASPAIDHAIGRATLLLFFPVALMGATAAFVAQRSRVAVVERRADDDLVVDIAERAVSGEWAEAERLAATRKVAWEGDEREPVAAALWDLVALSAEFANIVVDEAAISSGQRSPAFASTSQSISHGHRSPANDPNRNSAFDIPEFMDGALHGPSAAARSRLAAPGTGLSGGYRRQSVRPSPMASMRSPMRQQHSRRRSSAHFGPPSVTNAAGRSSMSHAARTPSMGRSAAGGLFGGRKSMAVPTARQLDDRRTVLVTVSLPNLARYLRSHNAEPETARSVLGLATTSASDASDTYGGNLVTYAGGDVIYEYPAPSSAVAAAYFIRQQFKDQERFFTDPFAKSTRCYAAVVVVNISRFTVASTVDPWETITHLSEHSTIIASARFAAAVDVPLPAVLLVGAIGPISSADFVSKELTPGIRVVEKAKATDPDEPDRALVPHMIAAESATDIDERLLGALLTEPLIPCDICLADGASAGGGASSARRRGTTVSSAAMSHKSHAHARRMLGPIVLDLWKSYDVDGSGTLDHHELRDLLDDLGIQLEQEEFNTFFNAVDTDGSGAITLDELAEGFSTPTLGAAKAIATVRAHAKGLAPEALAELSSRGSALFNVADEDKTGSIGPEAAHRLFVALGIELSENEVTWMLERINHDGAGRFTLADFADLFDAETMLSDRAFQRKQRIQLVSRVMENQAADVFSTDEQRSRDRASAFGHAINAVYAPLLVLYTLVATAAACYLAAAGIDDAPSSALKIGFLCADTIPLSWVALKMAALPREHNGQVLFRRADVLPLYARSPELILDVLTVLPLDIIPMVLGDDDTYGWFRLNKCLLLFYFGGHLTTALGPLRPMLKRVISSIVWYIIVAMFFAAAMLFLARSAGEAALADATGAPHLRADRVSRSLAFYWATKHLAGQFRGQAIPESDGLLGLLIATILVGLPLFAGLLGVIGNMVNTKSSESEFLARIDEVRSYFSYASGFIPGDDAAQLEQAAVQYYRHLFETTGSLQLAEDPLADIPSEIGVRVTIETGFAILSSVPIFEEACENVEFVHEITTKMVPRVIEPGMVVMRKGERGSNMYFITYGDFNIVVENVGVVFTLRKGNFFGEIALLHNVKRTATIVCDKRRYANVLTLEKRDFDEVLQVFPQCLSAISKAAGDRLKQILDQEAEEQRQAKLKRQEQSIMRGSRMSPSALSASRAEASAGEGTSNPLAGPTISGPSADEAQEELPASSHGTTAAGQSQPDPDPDPVSDDDDDGSDDDYEVPEEPGEPPGAMRAIVEE